MSVASTYLAAAGAGLLVEGDQVSLSTDLRIEPERLRDLVTGAGHRLRPEAEQALQLVQAPADAHVWMTHLRALGLGEGQASEIILFLNRIGALRVRRTLRAKLSVAARQAWVLLRGATPRLLARRLPLDAGGLAAGTTLALSPVLAAGVATSVLLYGAGLGAGWLATMAGATAGALWLSIFAHESAHAIVLARARAGGAVLQQGMHLGVIHGPISHRMGIRCSLIGPIAGALTAILVLGTAYIITGSRVFLALTALMVLFHAASLLPGSTDGRNLRHHWLCRSHA